jgi:hypothetical protein
VKSWFDNWAKSAAKRDVPRVDAAEAEHEGISRRDMLKRAGVVGAATVWAAPVIQSVMAPAYAQASNPPPVCTPSDPSGCGGTCTSRCGFNKVCTSNTDCLSNSCTGTGTKHCAKSPALGACLVASDCTTGICTGAVCQKAAPAGTCATNSDCTTNVCTTNVCQKAANGGTCTTSSDCSDTTHNATCTGNVCKAHVNGTCTAGTGCLSGTCTGGKCLGVTNDTCANNGDCLSNNCIQNPLGSGKICA